METAVKEQGMEIAKKYEKLSQDRRTYLMGYMEGLSLAKDLDEKEAQSTEDGREGEPA